jgi:uncharacterized protein YjiS (DUF1127 family)
MTCIDIESVSQRRVASASSPPHPAFATWLSRAWTILREARDYSRGCNSLLRLNDRLLRDIGQTRDDLEFEAMFWPRRRPKPPRSSEEEA